MRLVQRGRRTALLAVLLGGVLPLTRVGGGEARANVSVATLRGQVSVTGPATLTGGSVAFTPLPGHPIPPSVVVGPSGAWSCELGVGLYDTTVTAVTAEGTVFEAKYASFNHQPNASIPTTFNAGLQTVSVRDQANKPLNGRTVTVTGASLVGPRQSFSATATVNGSASIPVLSASLADLTVLTGTTPEYTVRFLAPDRPIEVLLIPGGPPLRATTLTVPGTGTTITIASLSGFPDADLKSVTVAAPDDIVLAPSGPVYFASSLAEGERDVYVRVYTDPEFAPSVIGYAKFSDRTQTWEKLPASAFTLHPADGYIEIHLTDGGLGDDDGEVNGTIVDPGVPFAATTTTTTTTTTTVAARTVDIIPVDVATPITTTTMAPTPTTAAAPAPVTTTTVAIPATTTTVTTTTVAPAVDTAAATPVDAAPAYTG